jgi:hypothetical protein
VEKAEVEKCLEAVKSYNHLIEAWRCTDPSPSLGVAVIAGYRWLEVFCGGCRQIAHIDLVQVKRHPLTPISRIAKQLRCERCNRQGPSPTIRGLRCAPPETVARYIAAQDPDLMG